MTNALRRITPERSVLVYVDFVSNLAKYMTTIPADQYRNNVAAFAKFNRMYRIPAVILGEESEYYGEFLPEMATVDHDTRSYKRTQISGYVPEFKAWLRDSGRSTIIIGGVSTDNCVLHTTLDLLRDGYHVVVVPDVSGANSLLAEQVALARLRDAGAVLAGWVAVATELAVDFATPYGDDLKALVGTHWVPSTIGAPHSA